MKNFKDLLPYLNTRAIERHYNIPRGTINYYLNDERQLGKHEKRVQEAVQVFVQLFNQRKTQAGLRKLLDHEFTNIRHLCRAANVWHSSVMRWMSGDAPLSEGVMGKIKKLKL